MRLNVIKFVAVTLTASSVFGLTTGAAYGNGSSVDEGFQSSETDTFSGSGGFNPFDLIHQAQRGEVRSMGEFTTDAQSNIKNASLDFRAQQQLLLLQMLQQRKSSNLGQQVTEQSFSPQNAPIIETEVETTEEIIPTMEYTIESELPTNID